ncbi:hypothetical protein K3495_g11451 [Podosphaera aphanis]|nr:hypothetical protein K3495_g11451 [Podosphaera aphanis]
MLPSCHTHRACQCQAQYLAIIRAFEEWRPELEGAAHPIKVISDHKNLEYFMSTKQLNRRQARWAEFLSRFNFIIKYRPGKQGGKPDALTRRPEDLPDADDERRLHQSQVILKKENLEPRLQLSSTSMSRHSVANDGLLGTLFRDGYIKDPLPLELLNLLRQGVRRSSHVSLAECSELDGKLIYRGTLYVPNYDPLKLQILKNYHNNPSAGHPGRGKTFELISRDYYWPQMCNYISQYVRNCHACRRCKPSSHAKFGLLKPLPIPKQPWQEVSMDFVTGLSVSEGFDAIMLNYKVYPKYDRTCQANQGPLMSHVACASHVE